MKKWIARFIAMLAILILAGCGTSQTKTKNPVDKTSSTQLKKMLLPKQPYQRFLSMGMGEQLIPLAV